MLNVVDGLLEQFVGASFFVEDNELVAEGVDTVPMFCARHGGNVNCLATTLGRENNPLEKKQFVDLFIRVL